MTNFDKAAEKVLEHEKGYVDHKADKGGKTNLGITQKTYEAWIGRKLSDAEAEKVMRAITKDTAKAIYKKNYWDKVQGDAIKSYAIAFALFDQAINRGHESALKQAQKILGLPQDGVAGKMTVAALNALILVKGKEDEFINKYLEASKAFYLALIAKDPTQKAFEKGWLARVESIRAYVSKYKTTVAVASVSLVGVGLFFLVLYQLNKTASTQRA